MSSWEGKVVLVTGAAAGVGKGVSIAFARQGAVVGIGVRRPEAAEEVATAVREAGGTPHILRCDVTDAEQSQRSIEELVNTYGQLNATVHNAVSGRSSEPTDFENTDLLEWEDHASVTVRASWRLAVLSYTHLQKTKGAYLLMSSPAGIEGSERAPFYSAVKAAQRGFVRALAREWGPDGIRVNSVAPLAISPALENLKSTDPERVRRIESLVPLGWLGDPTNDIGPPSVFLCSEEARYITGQTLVVSGGRFTSL